jgi:hypothetical protein
LEEVKLRKAILIVIFGVLLVGCSQYKTIHFLGESAHWKGDYSAKYNDSKDETEYIFSFKNAKKDTVLKDFVVDINGKEYKGKYTKGTFKVSNSCSGGSEACQTLENEPIKVTINWDDKYKETFFLKSDK